MIAIFCAASIYGVIPLSLMHGVDFKLENYTTAFVGSLMFTTACYSLAVISSVLFSEKSRASTVSSGAIILMYVLFVISTLQESVQNLKYVSFFNYFSGGELLAKNTYPDNLFLALGGFSIGAIIVTLIIFNRRDMSV